jgi:hypothetical protein
MSIHLGAVVISAFQKDPIEVGKQPKLDQD